eukprot:m.358196 g.358196  ORF g.358196 m.358196 type:complete len:1579 (+) comp18070_c0_seq1:103-4839(+)
MSCQTAMFQANTRLFSNIGKQLHQRKAASYVVFAIGVCIIAAFVPGLIFLDQETDIQNLYVQEKSQATEDFAEFESRFGGLPRSQAIAFTNTQGNAANKETYRAIIAALTPIFKADESARCSELDGVQTTLSPLCSEQPFASESFYCTCAKDTESVEQFSFEAQGENDLGNAVAVNLTVQDLCETAPVPPSLAPSLLPSKPATSLSATSSPAYVAALQQSLQANSGALQSNVIFTSQQLPALSACEVAFQTAENSTVLATNRSDFTTASLACSVAAVQVFGVAQSLVEDGSYNLPALQAAWSAYFINSSLTEAEVAAIYDTESADGKDAAAAANIVANYANVSSMVVVVTRAVASAFGASQYFFLTQQNVISYAYQEAASCMAQFVDDNRATLEASLFADIVSSYERVDPFLTNNIYDVSTWDTVGVEDMRAYATQELANGQDIRFDTDFVTSSILRLYDNSSEPYASVIAQEKIDALNDPVPQTLSDPGLVAGYQKAYEFLVAGVDITTQASKTSIGQAYTAASGTVTSAPRAINAILTASQVHLAASTSAYDAVISAITLMENDNTLLMPSTVTLNGTFKPLPEQWGIDRFPCNRASPLDVFQEGSFDYPYALRQLQSVAASVSHFFTSSFHQENAAEANCIEPILFKLQDALYPSTLPSSATYQTANFDAFATARATFNAAISNGDSQETAASAAATAFVGAGGSFYSNSAPTTASTFSANDLATLAASIAETESTVNAIQQQLMATMQTFAVMGYGYRPSFESLSESMVLATTLSAIADSDASAVSSADCVLGNREPTFLGDDVPGCLLSFAGTKLPSNLVFGNINTTVDALRVGFSTWNPEHPTFQAQIGEKLNKNLTTADREAIMLDFEQGMIDFLLTLRDRESSTDFEAGAAFENVVVDMQAERSTSDTIETAAVSDRVLYIAGGIIVVAYVMLSFSNLWSFVYSHMALGLWGFIVVGLSTAASLGFAAYIGLEFTPLTTNVTPFLAIGIGIDDMFVIARAYSSELSTSDNPKTILTRTLGQAGPSVTFTSLINLVVFLIASAAPVTVVRLFCYQMAINIFFNYLSLALLFLPTVLWDCKRVLANKGDFGCCRLYHYDTRAKQKAAFPKFCGGSYARILLSTPARVIVLFFFATWTFIGLWQGIANLQPGLKLSAVARTDGYQHDFAVLTEDAFLTYPGILLSYGTDLSIAQENIMRVAAAIDADAHVTGTPVVESFWLSSLWAYTGVTAPIDTADFYEAFSSWMQGTGLTFVDSLYCEDSTTSLAVSCSDITSNNNVLLKGATADFYLGDLVETTDFTAAIESTRDAVATVVGNFSTNVVNATYDSVLTGSSYLFWEQYLHSKYEFYLVVGLCVLGVFVASLLFHFNWRSALIMSITVLMSTVQIVGILPIWGIELNVFSLANMCLAVGMGVEFTAHIAHHFLLEQGPDTATRVESTLGFVGSALFHGSFTSLLATLFIAGSNTGFIRQYFFGMFFASIVVSTLNGLVFLPVLLSLLGPEPAELEGTLELSDNGESDGAKDFSTVSPRGPVTTFHSSATWGKDTPSARPATTSSPAKTEAKYGPIDLDEL